MTTYGLQRHMNKLCMRKKKNTDSKPSSKVEKKNLNPLLTHCKGVDTYSYS